MAKKKNNAIWGDIAKDIASAAVNPTGFVIKKGVDLAVDLFTDNEDEENDNDDEEENYIQLADSYYNKQEYENALAVAEHAKDDYYLFYYYRFCGLCHYNLWEQKKTEGFNKMDELGIDGNTDDDDPRWEKMDPYFEAIDQEKQLAYQSLKQCLKAFGKEDCEISCYTLAHVYWLLMDLCETNYNGFCEQRRYAIAAMMDDEICEKVKKEYNDITDKLLDAQFDDGYLGLQKIKSGKDQDNFPNDPELIEIYESQLFSNIDYHERQFIYIAKDIDALAGCYDDSIPWVFTIDRYPIELKFPLGHPQPNTLYYAHPARKGYYLPIENADEELFNDKVREFRRLSQCLGATEIEFNSIKGNSLTESKGKGMNIEVGGEYKGVGAGVGYGNKKSGSKDESIKGGKNNVRQYNPTKAPYIPNDIAWLDVDPEWQSFVKERLEGNMLHYSMKISSEKTMAVSQNRLDDVKVAFKTFIANADVHYSQEMERSFRREEKTEWVINVTFKPLNELPMADRDDEAPKDEPSESDKELYERLRIYSCIEYYCLRIVYEDKNEEPNLRRIMNRVRKDTNIEIEEYIIKGETKCDVEIALDNYLSETHFNSADWYSIVPTLPHKSENEKFMMEAYYKTNVENKGGAIVGIVTSGTISVGDKVLLTSTDEKVDYDYECTVAWIERNGKYTAIAKAGESIGLGIDDDIDSIDFRVDYVGKLSEWEDNDEELTAEEQKYLDNLKDFLDDDSEITPRERKMLDRIRQNLGISEERAKELEESLAKPQLTDEEQEYLDIYREYAEKGEITEKERRKLDISAKGLDISSERAKEIESME